MSDKKPAIIKITTPRIRLGWPKLVEPDYGTKDYPKPDGEFSTKAVARLEDPAIKAFLDKLRPVYEQAIEEAKAEFAKLKPETRKKLKAVTENPLYTELLDKETEEPTGELEFKFAKKASYVAKKGPSAGKRVTSRVPLYGSQGRVINKAPEIWGGSIAKITFSLGLSKDFPVPGYFIPGTGIAGLKLVLEAVQIIELRQGGARSASDYGFGKEEDGYSHSDTEDASGNDSAEDGEQGEDGGTHDF